MHIIGITGGVGAGKSELLSYMEKTYQARILQADEAAKLLMEPDTDCMKKLRRILPAEVFLADGSLDRPALSRLFFSRENLREQVNGIVHPAVKEYIREEIQKQEAQGETNWFVIEAALLIEEHYEEICEELWYVYASEQTRAKRLAESRGYTKERIRAMFQSQLPEEDYRTACDVTIHNDGDLTQAKREIDEAISRFLS